jgi:TRAP-type C4-dicarboxylate transport system permease small subunit
VAKRSGKSGTSWLMYERRHDQLAPRSVFVKRMVASLAVALGLICVALLVGIAGYHFLGGFNLIDSLLEASMILGGMGPIKELPNDAAKIFASIYALFSGLLLIAMMGIILSPVIHRVMHKFHVDEKDVNKSR